MMDDLLVEIDTRTLKVARHFIVTKGKEMAVMGAPRLNSSDSMSSMPGMSGMKDTGGHDGSAKAGRQLLFADLGATFR